MKFFFRFAAIWLALSISAYGQTPKAKSTLQTEITNSFPDQTTGAITPAIVRGVLGDFVASWQQYGGVNAQSGTTYTIQASDYGQLVTFNNGSGIAVTLPQAAGSFSFFNFYVSNKGAGTVTITPTTSTINGSSSLAVLQNQTVWVVSDGTNYQVWKGNQVSTTSGNTSKFATVSGALISNDCIKSDASGNLVDAGGTCSASSGIQDAIIITAGSTPAKCDYRFVVDAAMGSGSTTLTSASASFTINDVGKYIAVQGAAAAGANLFTTIASFSNSTTVILTSGNASGGSVSGKVAEIGTDDTTNINSTIATAVSQRKAVYVPSTANCLISRLNLTNLIGFRLFGAGPFSNQNGSAFFAKQDGSYGTANGHMFDLTGSSFVSLDNFQIGVSIALAAPTTAIFMAQIASNASNRNRLAHLYISGQFTVSTFYDYGVPSLYTVQDVDFYNYKAGSGSQNTMTLTATNFNSLTSSFATVTSGTLSTSDIVFQQVEFHKFAGAGANNATILLDATANIIFISGVLSGGATEYVDLNGALGTHSFHNVTMETESQPVTPTNGYKLEAGATLSSLDDLGTTYILGASCTPVSCNTKFSIPATLSPANIYTK